jgi:hypothetical protein
MKLTDEATLVEAITGHDPGQLEGWNTASVAELAVFHREQFAQYAALRAAVERALMFHQTTHIHATLRAALSASGAGVGWHSMSTAPTDREVWFWVVPKTAEETYVNTSGEPIRSSHPASVSRTPRDVGQSLESDALARHPRSRSTVGGCRPPPAALFGDEMKVEMQVDHGWNPRVIQVIEVELELRGDGTPASPYRRVRQYYTLDGKLLAEVDPLPSETK